MMVSKSKATAKKGVNKRVAEGKQLRDGGKNAVPNMAKKVFNKSPKKIGIKGIKNKPTVTLGHKSGRVVDIKV